MDSTGILVTAGLTALSASISYNINTHIPKPYMDEIFHIPQAQKYCQGDFFLVSNLQNSKARILKKKTRLKMLFRSKTAIQIIFPRQCLENQSFQKHKNREDRVNFSAKTQTISAMITSNRNSAQQ